jgi:hypothetical protein
LKKNLARRDRVVFISLVDILLQLSFVLLIVILFVFKEHETLFVQYENLKKNTMDSSQCIAEKDQCQKELSDIKKQYLQACITLSKTAPAASVKFSAYSTNTVIFQGFTPEYFKYLAGKNDSFREQRAKVLKANSMINLSDIESTFGFIREGDCYHDFSVAPIASINSVESGEVWRRIAGTFRKLAE